MSDELPSSREVLKNCIQSHADLAKDLLKLLNKESGEGPNRFQMASIIILLSGVDKMLNIAFGLLYLGGKVAWKDIVFNPHFEAKAGFIECHKGLFGKIKTLEKLGADVSPLLELIEIRNYSIHDSFIYAGYVEKLDELTMEPIISPGELTISYPLFPETHWTEEVIQYYTDGTLNVVSAFVDTTDWKETWLEIGEKLEGLPTYEIDPDLVYDPEGHNKNMSRIEELNNTYIGIGLTKLLDK